MTATPREVTIRVHAMRADEEREVDFDLTGLVIAGLAGILAIMAVLYAAPFIGLPRIDVVGLAGTLFTDQPGGALITGALLWVGIGMLWTVLYVGLWTRGYGRATLASGLLFGLIHGNIVMAGFPLFLALHRDTSPAQASMGAGICLVLAHVIFGATVALIYRQYLPPERRP